MNHLFIWIKQNPILQMASVASLLYDETFSNFPDKFALDAKKSHENCATLLSNLGPLYTQNGFK